MRFDDLQLQIQNAKPLDFGTILDQVIDLFKKIWLKGFLVILLLVLVTLIITFLLSLIGLGPETITSDWYYEFNFFTYYQENLISSLPQTILLGSFTLGLVAGFYRTCKGVDHNTPVDDDLFYYFKGDHLRKVFMLGVIYALIATIAQSLFFLPYIYVVVPLSFFSVIFAFNPELTELEIVKLSFNLGTKKWLLTFGLLVLTGIMGMLGAIACGIGMLFTISIAYLPVYFIYKNTIGFIEKSEIDEIGLLQE